MIGTGMTAAQLAMENAGYIIGSYVITVSVIAAFAARVLLRARRLADQVDDENKYWT